MNNSRLMATFLFSLLAMSIVEGNDLTEYHDTPIATDSSRIDFEMKPRPTDEIRGFLGGNLMRLYRANWE